MDTAPRSPGNPDRDFKNWKKAQDLLLAYETRYRRLFETAQDGVLILDAGTGQIVDANPFLINLLGFSHEQFLGKKIWDIGVFKDIVANKDNFEELQRKEAIRYENLPLETSDGRRINVEFVSNVYTVDNKKVIQCNIRDITDRKQAEAVIHESEQRFHTIFDSARDGMLIVDPDTHRFVMANAAFLKQTGYSETELLSLSISDIHPPADLPHVIEQFEKQIHGEISMSSATPILRKDGTVFFADINSCMITLWDRQHTFGIFRDITERKHLENALVLSEQIYHSYVDHSPLGIFVVDGAGHYMDVNQASCDLLGYSREELLSMNVLDLSLPRERQQTLDQFTSLKEKLKTESSVSFEIHLKKKDGFACPVILSIVKLPNDTIMAFALDITDRKKIEVVLNATETRYRRLFETAQDGILILDAGTGQIVEVNPFLIAFLGFSREEFLGKKIWEIGLFKDIVANKDNFEELQRKESIRYENLPLETADGRNIAVEFVSNVYMVNDKKVIQCNIRDITERKQAEEALRNSQQILEGILNTIPVRVFWKNKDLTYLGCNTPFARDAGFEKPEDVIGRDDYSMVWRNQAELYRADDLQVIRSGKPKLMIEEPQSTPSGETIYLLTNKMPLLDARGEGIGVLGTYLDVTERKMMTDQIKISLAEKEMLLKEIHHRVKNNLQIISSMLNMQIRKLDDPKTIDTLRDSQNRVQSLALVHEYLYRGKDLAHIDLKNYITTLGKGLFQSYEAAKQGVRFNVDIRDIYVDINTSIPLGLISNELITNSLKYAFRDKKDGKLTITATEDPQALTFMVADNGIGMSPDITLENQTSLGLRLVHSLTDQLNGTVTIDRTEGTKFVLTIPKPDKNKEKV